MSESVPKQRGPAELDEQILKDPNCPVRFVSRHDGREGRQLDHGFQSLGDYWLQKSEQYGENDYVATERHRATYADVRRASTVLAHGLQRKYRVQAGERVAIVSRNTIEFVTIFWALQLVGAVAVPINGFQTPDVIAACVNMVGTKLAFVDDGAWKALREHFGAMFEGSAHDRADEPRLEHVIVVAGRDVSALPPRSERPWIAGRHADVRIHDWDDVMGSWQQYESAPPPDVRGISLDRPALIMFTSGTTSLPKAVVSTNDQVISSLFVSAWSVIRTIFSLLGMLPPPGSMPKRRALCMIPLFHVMGLHSVLINCTLSGDAFVMMYKFDVSLATMLIKREQVTSLIGIGFMVREIIKSGADLPSLSGFFVGGASSPSSLPGEAQRVGEITGGNGYGLTETNSGVLLNVGPSYAARPASVGIPPPMVDIRICDTSTGQFLPTGATGELLIRAPNVALGYYKDEKATRAAFRDDGFFCTGDIAMQDTDGSVYILDRAKDLIVRGGENISCSVVERALLNDTRVRDCAVLALPDEQLGERVAAICVVGADMRGKEQELVNLASTSLPRHAVPEYVWLVYKELPRTATGKVLKTTLRQELAAHVAAEQAAGAFRLLHHRGHL
ncbi:uncharacterized protein MJAP1_000055 [Malassezia japonica]|uniref:Uncharacterized protein n=1 Tax=Malassezia japonica TaxID=223818 RepID=A0AAF0EU17_9BASI|nr:uncharacterized protein MJAP1_000055 [Malassezia japonica]WFD37113.1 hypothetical protein MJAP1_000055 [Malassezia japonica]